MSACVFVCAAAFRHCLAITLSALYFVFCINVTNKINIKMMIIILNWFAIEKTPPPLLHFAPSDQSKQPINHRGK